jgi:RHS repeat-associated protein
MESKTNWTYSNTLLYQGKALDSEAGLYYFGSRWYDARIGVWNATDPASQFASPYMAMGGNPVVYVDPDGELVWLAVAIGAVAGGYTGKGDNVEWIDTDGDGITDTKVFTGGDINEKKRSNGIYYFSAFGFQFGWDSENIRHDLQNRFAHDNWSKEPQYGNSYPWVPKLPRGPRFVFQFGGF